MKKRVKIIIGLAAVCAGTLIFGACSSESGPYRDYAERGFDFTVCYDANGGKAGGKDDAKIVDVYSYENVKRGVKLYAPNDPRRGDVFNVERSGYFLAGWYAVRAPRVDGNGAPLDEEGNLCNVETDLLDVAGNPVYDEDGNAQKTYLSETGKAQGYTYAEKWDFNALLQREDFEYREGEYAFTLYAAWVPNFAFEVNGQEQEWICASCGAAYFGERPAKCGAVTGETGADGVVPTCGSVNFTDNGLIWHAVTSYRYNPTLTDDADIPIPTWNDETGVLDYGKLSLPLDKTFLAAYSTAQEAEEGNAEKALTSFKNEGKWDEETATATKNVARFYANWENGLWYRVSNPEQLNANAGPNRSYDLLNDVVFGEEDEWPTAFSGGEFTGTFRGNGYTISGATVRQTDAEDSYGGLFGKIASTAVFENISFENITYSLEAASRRTGAKFGLLAGELNREAKFTSVSVSGVFKIVKGIFIPSPRYDPITDTYGETPHVYDLGLLSGNYETCGLSLAEIVLKSDDVTASVEDETTGKIKIG